MTRFTHCSVFATFSVDDSTAGDRQLLAIASNGFRESRNARDRQPDAPQLIRPVGHLLPESGEKDPMQAELRHLP